jgi:biopolymer transport protein ExbB
MIAFDFLRGTLVNLIQNGGWVAAIQVAISVIALGAMFWKLWQFSTLRVGCHRDLLKALNAADRNDFEAAKSALAQSRSHLAAPLHAALTSQDRVRSHARTEAELSACMNRLEGGFRLFDTIAQTAPLLGLFGTVLGMIMAFQAMQSAGASPNPADLAGGIGVALLTTAAGLAISIPVSAYLSWCEARVSRERTLAERLLAAITAETAQVQVAPVLTGRLKDVA